MEEESPTNEPSRGHEPRWSQTDPLVRFVEDKTLHRKTLQQRADGAGGKVESPSQIAIGGDPRRRLATEISDGAEEDIGADALYGNGRLSADLRLRDFGGVHDSRRCPD